MFTAKKIAVGVTGGIAAYKTCELIRELKNAGAEVRVVATESALKFVTGLTFATLSENPVSVSLFAGNEQDGIAHIDIARWCDLLVVCPATANCLGKVAAGIADDILTTAIMATKAKVVFCPAMNGVMWQNAMVQANVKKLKDNGYIFVEPEWGAFATGSEGEGWGRLAEISTVVEQLKIEFLSNRELLGKKVIVSAGPTRERIDPVRFITNYSSGKMGFALAETARLRGADVVLVSGPNALPRPANIKYLQVEKVDEMQAAILSEYQDCDILLMAAAVSDFRPETESPHKLKKGDDNLTLKLHKTVDIRIDNAKTKLKNKKLDLIVLNDPLEADAAFAGDTNIVTLIDRDGHIEELPKLSKTKVAERILDRVAAMMDS
jgi:phosphopantothenoylcysteine decarboxylase/phosphopantothenate--cysteine ligase